MRLWTRRRRRREEKVWADLVQAENDRAARRSRELARRWQNEAFIEDTQLLPLVSFMTLGQEWRGRGGAW